MGAEWRRQKVVEVVGSLDLMGRAVGAGRVQSGQGDCWRQEVSGTLCVNWACVEAVAFWLCFRHPR